MVMNAASKSSAKISAPVRTGSALAGERLRTAADVVLRGIFLNGALAVIKIAAGIAGNSYALIADGVESSIDVASSIITWHGVKVAALPADPEHPYGHGKAEPLAAFLISLFVLGAAAFLGILSVREVLMPHHTPAPFTLLVLLTVIVVKEVIYRVMKRRGAETGSGAVTADAFHHRSDAITSAAAFIGITIALVGGPGYESADDYAAILACIFIGWMAWHRLRPALREMMDAAPDPEIEINARNAASRVGGVITLDESRVRKMGLEYFIDIHVVVSGEMSVREGHRIAHQVKDAIRNQNGLVADVLVHIEPDDPERMNRK